MKAKRFTCVLRTGLLCTPELDIRGNLLPYIEEALKIGKGRKVSKFFLVWFKSLQLNGSLLRIGALLNGILPSPTCLTRVRAARRGFSFPAERPLGFSAERALVS
jgi:hypothetical protein